MQEQHDQDDPQRGELNEQVGRDAEIDRCDSGAVDSQSFGATQSDRQRAAALLMLGLGPVSSLAPDAVYFTSRH